MAAEMPVDSFLDLLRQSGLVVDSQMLALMAEFSGEGARPESARSLASELVKRELLTEWQADMLLQGKHRGFRLGPHRILRPLGQGGMSKVFLAEHEMMRRRCAIKVLPSKYQEDPDLLSRFHLEARAIAALDHPHIVRAYDFNKDVRYGKEIHYLAMEYVEGQDLRRMVDEQGPLDYRKAADFICQAAEGLAHAHAAGFVHRDIKPANLLVDPNGVLKILDLGLAQFTFEGEDAWQSPEGQQSAVGTADYVAPEQVMDSRNVDGRADIYSLGYTFYFLLTGRRPFPKSTLVELLMAHRVETPEPIGKLRPDVPPELVEIVDRMTAKTPDLRFQTAKEVAEKLQAWLHDSESSREYSRISALMAAAMRAKSPSSEGSPGKLESAKESPERELTFLDDEPARSAGAKAVENQRIESAKPPEADAREKLRKLSPSESGRTAILPRAKADLLLELMPDQGQSALVARPQFNKHRGNTNSLLKSPWLWITVAGLVVVVLLFLAILFSLSSEKPSRSSVRKPAGKDDTHSEIPATTVQTPPKTPDAGQSQSPKPTPKPTPESREATVSAPPDAAEKSKPPAKLTPGPSTDPPVSVAPAPKSEHKQPSAEKSIDKDKLLTGLATIAFRFKDSDATNRAMNMVIERQAISAAARLRSIEVSGNSPNVMEIDLKTSSTAESLSLVLTAELKCRTPEDKVVTAWKLSSPVVTLDVHRARPDQTAMTVLLRKGTYKFFQQFVDDVYRARSKLQPK